MISALQEKEVIEVIRDRCEKQNTSLYEIGKDIIFEEGKSCQDYQCLNINGAFGRLADLKIRLLGRHQLINAALAAAVVLALSRFYQVEINSEAIKKGLYNTNWPGRFEIIFDKLLVVLDGAQNAASAQALKQTIIDNFPDKRIILILGISQDKDIKGICQALIPLSDEVILTQADNPRAADVDIIEEIIRSRKQEAGSRINKVKNSAEALELARQKARTEDVILVTGSLFLVGELRERVSLRNARHSFK